MSQILISQIIRGTIVQTQSSNRISGLFQRATDADQQGFLPLDQVDLIDRLEHTIRHEHERKGLGQRDRFELKGCRGVRPTGMPFPAKY